MVLRIHHGTDPSCRYCLNTDETIEHVLLYCPHVKVSRAALKKECSINCLRFNIKTLLTTDALRIRTEQLLDKFMHS